MTDRATIYIDGAWVRPASNEIIEVENPATEKVFATVPAGSAQDARAAVAAARAAATGWADTSRAERAEYLRRLHAALSDDADGITEVIIAEVGAPRRIASRIQTDLPIRVVSSYVDLLGADVAEERIGNSLVVREPVGVVAAITPWNYPLHQIVIKLAAALAAGCTIVVKPSEIAPLSAYRLFDAVHQAGLPAGVANLVPGYGSDVGEALAADQDVDMVSFTGSTRAGSRVAALAAGTVKKVALELGGKSANVVLDDGDLRTAVKIGVANAFLNSGQTCTAWTRLLVDDARYEEAVALAASVADSYSPGDPTQPSTRLGPLVSAAQRERVRTYVETGVEEGARLVTGGVDAPEGLDTGYFMRPTVLADVHPDATVAQEEIFGPVLSVIRYRDEVEALQIANNSPYGLAGAVWSADNDRALAFARQMRTGSVDVNGGAYNHLAPFGGYRSSGIGRELGTYGLAEFCEVKAIQL